MDKKVILAVAGSGKTTYIIDQLNLEKNALIITYTNNNYNNLKQSIIRKFGFLPTNIKLYTYFNFLYNFCYKPFAHVKIKAKGLNFNNDFNQYSKKNQLRHYQDSFKRLYNARLSKLLIELELVNEINERIAKYFNNFFIDEIQDFGGNDFNFLKEISKANVNYLLVGDYFQHTYDTSRDGNINKNLHTNLQKYVNEFVKMGFKIDSQTLIKSWRCSPTICNYISTKLGITIESNRTCKTDIITISTLEEAERILNNNNIIKLFYQKHQIYNCYSRNWGDSKGEDKYYDVCIVLNKTTFKLFLENRLNDLATMTKNKLYVAITRTKNNLFFISQDLIKN